MSQIFSFGLQGLMPSENSPPYADVNPCMLPWGGPTGVGGNYVQGLALSIVAGTVQSEVITVTIAGSTGTLVFTFTADKVYQATWLVGASLAAAQTALEGIFGAGNVTVTGTPGTTYTITFAGTSANRRIGGLAAVSATTAGTPTIARTTRGSSGAGQYDVYEGSTFTVIKAFNEYTFASNPQGQPVTDIPATGQPSAMPAYTRGRFFAADLVGVLSGAVGPTNGNLILTRGTAITDVGAVLTLLG